MECFKIRKSNIKNRNSQWNARKAGKIVKRQGPNSRAPSRIIEHDEFEGEYPMKTARRER